MKKTLAVGAIEARLPKEFITRLIHIIPHVKYQEVLSAFAEKRETTLRANTLKIKGYELRKKLADKSVILHPISWYKEGFVLKNISLRDLEKTEEYQNGFLYVQSLSSMIPSLVLDPKPGEKILDIAAAPGSKTTQMAAQMENKGEIVANDISPIRVLKLKANIDRQGVTNTKVIQKPGERIWMDYPEYFDKVLVDVPCSMEGRVSLKEHDTLSRWSLRNIKKLSHEQKYLLRSALSSTKVGGTIVYSTCTLAPEENEEVIHWILEKEAGKVILESVSILNLQTADALSSWENTVYNKEITKTKRILPSEYMEGFFIAKLKKIKQTVPQAMQTEVI